MDAGKLYRFVGAGQVTPLSTGPPFPSLMAYLASPISAITQGMPTQRLHEHSLHWEATC